MGRPPSNGAPSFRFSSEEVAEMEAILQKHEGNVPPRDFLMALAQSFSNSPERAGKVEIQMKQIWSWFQNRRFALKGKIVKPPGSAGTRITSPVAREEVASVRNVPTVPQKMAVSSGMQPPRVVNNTTEDPQMEFEARSARDGAWYDVQAFFSHRHLETDTPEVLVRFAGFEPEEDEWVNVLKHIRQRSLPCEAAECIIVAPGDLILCFQEGKEQALYFDAHVLDAQRRRHDVRGCRCRFLVRYDHDDSEEIVPLRKICRRPETDYRLQVLHAANEAAPPKPVIDQTSTNALRTINPNPSSAAISVPVPVPVRPVISVGSSVQPAASQSSTSTLARAPTRSSNGSSATSPSPTLSGQISESIAVNPTKAPESKKVEDDNPVQVPIEIETDKTNSITAQVTEQVQIYTHNLKIEGNDDSAPVSVPAPNQVLGTSDSEPVSTTVREAGNINPETTASTRSDISHEQVTMTENTVISNPSDAAFEGGSKANPTV